MYANKSGNETGQSGNETGQSGNETGQSGNETGQSGNETGQSRNEASVYTHLVPNLVAGTMMSKVLVLVSSSSIRKKAC